MAARALDVIVLDAQQRQSLVTVRSLGRRGVTVGAFDVLRRAPASWSRWCHASGVLPDYARDPDEFVDAVMDLIDRHSPRVLMVAHDGTIEALRSRRSEVERRVAIALPPEAALAVAVNKERTLALAHELGVGVPRSVAVRAVTELRPALKEVGLPAVIKPVTSWADNGVVRRRFVSEIVVNHSEARRVADRLLAAEASMLVQEWLPGAREAIWLMYAEGRLLARFAQVAYRMYPLLGGASVLRESISPPSDLAASAEQLVVAAGLTGYSEVEFRRDKDGAPKLMEINPRLSASVELAVRAGVDFPLMLYLWAAGHPLKSVTGYRLGLRMRWLAGDLAWLKETLRSQGRPDVEPTPRAIGAFTKDCFRRAGYDYLTLSDLGPAISASANFVASAMSEALPKRQASPPSRAVNPAPKLHRPAPPKMSESGRANAPLLELRPRRVRFRDVRRRNAAASPRHRSLNGPD